MGWFAAFTEPAAWVLSKSYWGLANVATCKPEQPPKAALLDRTSAAAHSIKGQELCAPMKAEYICADHPVTFIFRLRQGSGPYIPVCDNPPGIAIFT
jgi:hypothetical protein